MKKSPPSQTGSEIDERRISGRRQQPPDFGRRAANLILHWRGEISSAPTVPAATKRTVSQLSDAELALYLAGKQRRQKFSPDHAAAYGVLGWL